jgi:hypothetical protein
LKATPSIRLYSLPHISSSHRVSLNPNKQRHSVLM